MLRRSEFRITAVLFVLVAAPPALVGQGTARRLPPGACSYLAQPGVFWAASVRAFSSQYAASGWTATQVLGAPDVFPRYGDLAGAWAPGSSASPADFIEVLFGAPVLASELWIFETNGTGGLYAVSTINQDGSTTPAWSTTPLRLPASAAQLVVPLQPARVILGARVETSSAAAGTYAEIDAVGASSSALCSQAGAATAGAMGGGVRLSPFEYSANPISGTAVWGTNVLSVSSQYDAAGWGAQQILGPPNVFPRHGDLAGAWAPGSPGSAEDAIVVQFPPTLTRQVWIFETYGVGGLYQVFDVSTGSPVPLWSSAPVPASASEARVLRIDLVQPRLIQALRLVVSPAAVQSYPELDAVAVVP